LGLFVSLKGGNKGKERNKDTKKSRSQSSPQPNTRGLNGRGLSHTAVKRRSGIIRAAVLGIEKQSLREDRGLPWTNTCGEREGAIRVPGNNQGKGWAVTVSAETNQTRVTGRGEVKWGGSRGHTVEPKR